MLGTWTIILPHAHETVLTRPFYQLREGIHRQLHLYICLLADLNKRRRLSAERTSDGQGCISMLRQNQIGELFNSRGSRYEFRIAADGWQNVRMIMKNLAQATRFYLPAFPPELYRLDVINCQGAKARLGRCKSAENIGLLDMGPEVCEDICCAGLGPVSSDATCVLTSARAASSDRICLTCIGKYWSVNLLHSRSSTVTRSSLVVIGSGAMTGNSHRRREVMRRKVVKSQAEQHECEENRLKTN